MRYCPKSFRGMYAVDHLNMTVPVGAIYGFIGENGSGKSTTEKLICGHLVPDGGSIKLFGKDYTDPGVRVRKGANTWCQRPSRALSAERLCSLHILLARCSAVRSRGFPLTFTG